MSENRQREETSSVVEWGDDLDGEETWHADSQLPAAEVLSDLPEDSSLEEELEARDEQDLLDEDQDEPVEIAAKSPGEGGVEEEIPPGELAYAGQGGRRRSKTIARKQMLRDRRRMLSQGSVLEIVDYERPNTRSECRSAKRPCLYVSCRYHLYLDVNPMTGSIKVNFPDLEVWQLEETCALDVAERGGITLEEVGAIMNLTRERIRQVEVSGLGKLKGRESKLESFLDGRDYDSFIGPAAHTSPEGGRVVGGGPLPIVDE